MTALTILQITGTIAIAWVIWTFIASAYNASTVGRDDSDPPVGKRSGIQVHTDHLTGVQYLSGPRGGLVMRVDQHGNPIVAATK